VSAAAASSGAGPDYSAVHRNLALELVRTFARARSRSFVARIHAAR
jgi:hypothetical protein